MVVPVTSPAHSVAEFIAYAKANKGKSRSPRRSRHLGASLRRTVQAHGRHRNAARALSGAGPAFTDLVPGRVDVMFNNIGAVLPLIQGGKLRGWR